MFNPNRKLEKVGWEVSQFDVVSKLRTLYNVGVTVVLTGHAHDYERFALQNPEGVRDLSRGFRQFVVGTGGFL